MGEWVKVSAPATISNIGPGFDIFGMALQEPFDTIDARRIDSGVSITSVSGPGSDTIPCDSKLNSVGIAAEEVLRRTDADFGIELRIKKGIRPCSGIGSSGASAAGGAYAAHLLTDKKLTETELVLCAAHAEDVTSGGFHADNVAPCIMGGFTIIRSYQPLEVVSIEPPKDLGVVVAMPDVMVATKESRRVLPQNVPVKDLVFHVGNASCMAYAMTVGDIELIGRSAQDAVFEPARTHLVPHLRDAEKIAMGLGAKASFLGGSGPCVISFFNKKETDGKAIAEGIVNLYKENGMRCDSWITAWGRGCRKV